jgi:hypothetical protein
MLFGYLKLEPKILDIHTAIVINVSLEVIKLQFYLLPSRLYENCSKTYD